MGGPNFMLADLLYTTVGCLFFPLFTVFPGYVCAWLIDAFGFRRRSRLPRLTISVPLSIGVSPGLAYLLYRCSEVAVWAGFGILWASFVFLLVRERRLWTSFNALSKPRAKLLYVALGWVALGLCCVIDLQIGNRLYFSFLAHDYTLRAAITSSITRSGVPPNNPYFFPGHSVTLRYHYFWFILCSLVQQISFGLVSPRQAMMAGTIWGGLGLISIIPIYLRFFQPKGRVNFEKRTLIALALLMVTGLDILPVAIFDILSRRLLPFVDAWNNAVVTWMGSIMWAPHHVASLVACLIGFLLIYVRDGGSMSRGGVGVSLAAGICFASALGLSVYVTLVFAVFIPLWLLLCAARKDMLQVKLFGIAGVVAVIASLPYLIESLVSRDARAAGGGHFAQFAIRSFMFLEFVVRQLFPGRAWAVALANLMALPVNYLLEFGFFLFVGVEQWRRMRRQRNLLASPELCACAMVAVSLFICTFFSSGLTSGNDLGMRGILLAQFILLVWGAEFINEGFLSGRPTGKNQSIAADQRREPRALLLGTLILGVAGTAYELAVVRSFPVLVGETSMLGPTWLSTDHANGSRTYALRQFYQELKRKLPETAVLEHNPDVTLADVPFGLYADRQVAAEDMNCGDVFGGDVAYCEKIIRPIAALFKKNNLDVGALYHACSDAGIDAVIVQSNDPVWADKKTWVWQLKPLLASPYARAYACSGLAAKGGA